MSFAPDRHPEPADQDPLDGDRRDAGAARWMIVVILVWVVVSALGGS